MQQRITAWLNLLSGGAEEAVIDHGDEDPAPYQLTDLVRQTIEETFTTLKWSRVISLQDQDPDLRSNWLMAPDIIEQREAQMEIERAP